VRERPETLRYVPPPPNRPWTPLAARRRPLKKPWRASHYLKAREGILPLSPQRLRREACLWVGVPAEAEGRLGVARREYATQHLILRKKMLAVVGVLGACVRAAGPEPERGAPRGRKGRGGAREAASASSDRNARWGVCVSPPNRLVVLCRVGGGGAAVVAGGPRDELRPGASRGAWGVGQGRGGVSAA
jgi:hypothetical protein